MPTPGADTIIGQDNKDDFIHGLDGNDLLAGLGGNDRLLGDGGNDTLLGGDGNDRLEGGFGADLMIGGLGNDTYLVDNAKDVVQETTDGAAGGVDRVESKISFSLAALGNVENLTLTGKDNLSGTGNGLANVITGNGGANTLSGGGGNDRLDGGVGADHLIGGTGNDTYVVDNAGDQVDETLSTAKGGGIDTVLSSVDFTLSGNLENLTLTGAGDISGLGNKHANVMIGNAGANVLQGGEGSDTLDGGAGNDTLNGGGGTDKMSGGLGDDVYFVGNPGDVVIETATLAKGGGVDTVVTSFSYTLGTNLDNLTLSGSANINGTGNALNNLILGNNGANTLKGGGGNDTLVGDTGDGLLGEDGNDTLVLKTTGIKLANGGDGIDTLKLDAISGAVDLTGALGAHLKSIEIVDLDFNGSGLAQNLILDAAIVASLAGKNGAAFGEHTLMVKGNLQDSVTLDTTWTLAGTVTDPFGQSGSYNKLVSGDATLLVESDVAVKGLGTGLGFGALDGSNGFRIDGAGYHALNGQTWLANIGDVNGDGFNDLLLGDPTKNFQSGGAAVVFGHAGGVPAVVNVDTMDAATGFRIQGHGGSTGAAVGAAGDLNGDGYADLVIGAPQSTNGSAFVIFGHTGSFGDGFGSPNDFTAILNGKNGFEIAGAAFGDNAGRSVASVGDINGDGYDDLMIGAPGADPAGKSSAGSAYVVFGHAGGFDAKIDLSTVNGTTGFRLDGAAFGSQSGYAVGAAGDVNGDGFADMVVAGTNATAIVFGHGGSFASPVDLGALNGGNGFVINGGRSVSSAGDINGDGYDDVIVGDTGLVVFGHKGAFDAAINAASLNGGNGFSILQAGATVAKAGDVNGDGYDDYLVSHSLDAGHAGETYLVFGHAGSFGAQLDLTKLTESKGFKLDGINSGDYSGAAVSAAGDINGDGYDDLVIGAIGAQPDGQSYVIFGKDFTGAVHSGTFGTSAAEAFVGTANADVFYGGGGLDSFEAGAGDDQIYVESPLLLNLDGGAGHDIANLSLMGPLIDLTGDLRGKVSNIEQISLVGNGNNVLKLDTEAVAALVGGEITKNGANTLRIDGDSNDSVLFSGEWTNLGAPAGYTQVTNGSLTVLVQGHMHVEGVGAPLPDLTKLDGKNGFTVAAGNLSAAGAGDLNGDGYSDLVIGSNAASHLGYIIYGHGGQFPADTVPPIGSTTFTANTGGNLASFSVDAAGDVNGDGYDDVIVGVSEFGNGPGTPVPGAAFVVFGSAGGLGAQLDLPALTGANGFQLNGANNSQLGWSVSGAGDVNGDGYDDVIVGTSTAGTIDNAYVVFGHGGTFAADMSVADLNGANGFSLLGNSPADAVGHSVSSAGDINGDGYADLIVGGQGGTINGKFYSGESFVVFGHAGAFAASMNVSTLSGSDGFKIAPVSVTDTSGILIAGTSNVSSAGDLNGDGYDDVVVGVYAADPAGKLNAGSTYVVFGHAGGFNATLDLTTLDAAHGFRIDGVAANDSSGWSVSGAGDVNGDGYADLLVSAHLPTSAGGGGGGNPGEAYVIFGHAGGFGDHLDLATLKGDAGFQLTAPAGSSGFGMTVAAAGDLNGDGFADLTISDYGQNKTYVVFGADFTGSVNYAGDATSNVLTGGFKAETFVGGDSRDIITGNGGKDMIQGGGGSDIIHVQFPNRDGESFNDINHNGQYDQGEPFLDANANSFRDGPGSGPAIFGHVDGGTGYDFLLFDSAGALDFGDLDNNPATSDRGKITNIEFLDFNNDLANDITLHKADVLDMNPSDFHFLTVPDPEPILRVNGDGNDTLHLTAADGWSNIGTDTGGFTIYASDAVKIAVDPAIHVIVG
jgi:Ca2+-binding RTX toxin-like protein